MFRELWARLTGRSSSSAEGSDGSTAERRFASGSYEDHQADEFVSEHLGGIEPDRLRDDDPLR